MSSLSEAILALGKARSHREPNLGFTGVRGGGLTGLSDVIFCQKKSLHESCIMCRRVVVMKLICSLGHCECDGHTVHKLSQRRLTADWLAPRESDCSQVHSKVSSDWLPSYIKAMRPVLEIFKVDGYFPDSPACICVCVCVFIYTRDLQKVSALLYFRGKRWGREE